jgi:dihydroorotase
MNKMLLARTCTGLSLLACMSAPHITAQGKATASAASTSQFPEKQYDLLLKGGHVIDDKNKLDAIRDIAIKDGKIAKIAIAIPADSAIKTVDVKGLYVTPGLIDIHVHVFWGVKKNDYADGDWSIPPDGYTLRDGVTTVVDAGSSGWRNFDVFKERVIDRSQTRVLAMLNIVGAGMGSNGIEQNTEDMDGQKTGEMALKYPGVIVGVKSAHFTGPEWLPYEQAIKAGNIAHVPVMIDYGSRRIERPLYQLLEEKLRPGDIYTHMYMGGRGEQNAETGGPGKGMWEGRKRGIFFDVGHGQSSFNFAVAVPLIKAGFIPDSISTDIHSDNLNEGLKGQLTTADKFLAMGLPLKEVIAEMTWHPALEVQQTQLGNLSEGAIADIAVLNLLHGDFGYIDGGGVMMKGTEKLECELTVKDGKFVYDLNGRAADLWDQPPSAAAKQAKRWTSLRLPTGLAPRVIDPAVAARAAKNPPRWQPYDTDAAGKTAVKANAKMSPAKKPMQDVPSPASTWPDPPSAAKSSAGH